MGGAGAAAGAAGGGAVPDGEPPESEVIPDKYHIVVTSGGGVYSNWETEICYYWYLKVKDQPGSSMGGFTRLLHAKEDDYLSKKIRTIRVDPLGHPGVGSFPPLARPLALKMLMDMDDNGITEDYILMGEPDHIFLEPVPNWATPTKPASFPFFYINFEEQPDLVRKWNKRRVPVNMLPPIGNSPTIIHKDQLKEILKVWPDLTLEMFNHNPTREAWGWVLEMYAFAFSSALVDSGLVEFNLRPDLMLQPPWDKTDMVDRCTPLEVKICPERKAKILHYTYGFDFDKTGEYTPGKFGEAWRFDKRAFQSKNPKASRFEPSKLPAGMREKHPLSYRFAEMMYEACTSIWGDSGI